MQIDLFDLTSVFVLTIQPIIKLEICCGFLTHFLEEKRVADSRLNDNTITIEL
jgi:hypothetical protein